MNRLTLTELHKQKLPMGVLAAALLPDGNGLVAGCMDGVYVASLDTSIEPRRLYSHGSYVSSVGLLGDETLVSASYDGTACWFDLKTETEIRRVKLHDFWSWDMAVSPDGKHLVSVTGQYLAGGYKYEPQTEREPSIRIVVAETGEIRHSLPHVPSVQAVCFSPDGRHIAAGNLMGEVRVFRVEDGEMVANFTTPDFTSWGIIKSHCYLGGIFAMAFTLDGSELLMAGMGPMHDPMAGNGKQLWQTWSWQDPQPKRLDQTHEGESGEGLMETLAVHPSGEYFVMGGRLRGGEWNVALFEMETGSQIATLKTGCRVTQALFSEDGKRLILVGAQGQPKDKKDGRFPDFGRLDVFEIA